jgi:hypothetical protein
VEDYHTSAVLCCRGVYRRELLPYMQENPVRTISFDAILNSVLTKLLTVLLALLLLGRTSGWKNPQKHSVPGGADGTRTRDLPIMADRWSFSGRQLAIQVTLERPRFPSVKILTAPENQDGVVSCLAWKYSAPRTQSQSAQREHRNLGPQIHSQTDEKLTSQPIPVITRYYLINRSFFVSRNSPACRR